MTPQVDHVTGEASTVRFARQAGPALAMPPRWQTAKVVRDSGQSAFLFWMEYRDRAAINANAATQCLPAASQDLPFVERRRWGRFTQLWN